MGALPHADAGQSTNRPASAAVVADSPGIVLRLIPPKRHARALLTCIAAALLLAAATAAAAEPFPEPDLPTDVQFSMEGGPCLWGCPVFMVTLLGDGTVVFEGLDEVLLPGRHIDHVDPEAVDDLLADFRTVDFFALEDRYVAQVTDLWTTTLSLRVGDRVKTVVEYGGTFIGMPESVIELERHLLGTTGAGKWIWGTPETITMLAAEGFDFRSREAADLLAFAAARPYDGSHAFFGLLLDRPVPLWGVSHRFGRMEPIGEVVRNEDSSLRMGRLLVEAAVARGTLAERTLALPVARLLGDDGLALRLIEAGADPEAGRTHDLLAFAAAVYGDPGWMAEVIAPRWPATPADIDYALLGAAMANRPHMIRQLLDAGADPRTQDGNGRTPLGIAESSGFREVADMLIGADAR